MPHWVSPPPRSRSPLVQRWGRRVPAALLAAGSGAALVGGIAGAATVALSLTGLREDHGQWGIDSHLLAWPRWWSGWY